MRQMHKAPKDGTHVLLLIDGQWIEGWWMDGYDPRWRVVTMDSHGCGCCGSDDPEPTSWLRLPKKEQSK